MVKKVWVLIPAYNEAARIAPILDELKQQDLSVLVVDDGSTDGTSAIASQKADKVIKLNPNRGKGMAIQQGIQYLLEKEKFDYLITMDADGQHAPSDIKFFLDQADKGERFVVGNRMVDPAGMPKKRILTNMLMSWFISRIVGQKIPDTQCGYRLMRREILENVQLQTKKFEIESEILIKASRSKIPIKSIPIKSIYFQNPQSKIRPFRDAWRFFKFILRLKSKYK